jgi:hypothetical protein
MSDRARSSQPGAHSQRARRSRQALAGGLLSAVALLALTSTTLAGGVKGSGGVIGKFTFGGQLTGSLTTDKSWNDDGVTTAGCQITTDPSESNVYFFNANVKLSGHAVALLGAVPGTGADLDIEASKVGATDTLAAPNYTGSVNFGTYIKGKDYQWLTNADGAALKSAGTLTLNAKGTGGSLNATLVPVTGTGATSTLTIKGSWSYCRPLPH